MGMEAGLVLVVVGIVVVVAGVLRLRGGRKVQAGGVGRREVFEIELERLGLIWRGREKIEVALEELARVWKTQEEDVKEVAGEVPEFRHDCLLEFYLNYLRGRKWFKGRVRDVVLEVMRILDEKGDVSSVVKGKMDGYELNEDLFGILERVSLVEHSVRVARKVFEMGVSGIWEPQAVLACLAHDLGKIPEYHGKYYSLGDHPVISVAVLKEIELFRGLSFAEEVEKAILYHHRTGKGELVEILKKADRLAREEEVRLYQRREEEKRGERGKEDVDKRRKDGVERKVGGEGLRSEVERGDDGREERVVGREGVMVVVGEDREDRDERVKVEEVDLSWVDVRKLIEMLGEHVNRVEGGRWIAVSFDGVVYVHPQGLWGLLKKMALQEKRVDVVLMEGDKKMKRSLMVELVRLLRREGYIDGELIKDGYFAGPFKVYRRGEEPVRVLYTPFRAEVFGKISELELRKKGTILEEIERIEPDYTAFE